MCGNVMLVIAFSGLFSVDYVCTLENLALNKPTWQEHPWPEPNSRDVGSENAVDGMYTDRGTGGQCTINADGYYTAEWRVDLGSVVRISYINIFYRTENQNPGSFVNRMADFSLYISNTTSKNEAHLCYKDQTRGNPSVDQRVNCSMYGRFVIYFNERSQNNNPSYLSQFAYNELCELEVYGCRGSFGDGCQYACPTNCLNGNCNAYTGDCLKCPPGYYGQHCQYECSPGYYGYHCVNKCSKRCSVPYNCDRVTGKCNGGCMSGWAEDTCKECHTGFYGKNCTEKCSVNCLFGSACDRFTGECTLGCQQGWTGSNCNQHAFQVCDNGYFGAECNRKCGHCLQTDHCNHVNGSCLNGCLHGYKGDYCNETCPPGFFGLDCINRCDSYCSGNGSCDPVLGICTEGCKRGWNGLICGLDRLNCQSYGDNTPIVVGVVVSVVIIFGGSIIHVILWRRKTGTTLQVPSGGPIETSQQYTELAIINNPSNYDEIHS